MVCRDAVQRAGLACSSTPPPGTSPRKHLSRRGSHGRSKSPAASVSHSLGTLPLNTYDPRLHQAPRSCPSVGRDPTGRLGLAKRVPSARKHLVKVVLKPSDIWSQPGKFPYSVHLPVPVLVGAVRMALDRNTLAASICVPLVRHTKLMPPNDFLIRHLLPLGSTDEVLCFQQRIA